MAKSKLAVVESGAEQAVVEPEVGIDSQPAPENSAVPESGEAPAPELTDEEAAILAHEGEAALREMGEGQLEPPTPFDIPPPGDVVVSFDKINEILSEKQATAREAERIAAQDTPPELPATEQQPEKKAARQEQPSKAEKAKKAAPAKEDKPPESKKAPVKEEAPPPEPEKPPEPKEAPRKGEQEQIVYINLSELHGFKNHPFRVRDDEEMRAMVESVKDKGVTQALRAMAWRRQAADILRAPKGTD